MLASISEELACLESARVARDFDDGHVQTVAETQIGRAGFAAILRRHDFALGSARSETAGNDDALHRLENSDHLLGRHRFGVDPDKLGAGIEDEAGKRERLSDAHIGVVQLHIFADDGDAHRALGILQSLDQLAPVAQLGFVAIAGRGARR